MTDRLLELIRGARRCVAFTGAGVSTLSGIPDFRGAWPPELARRFSPEVLALYLDGLEECAPLAGASAPFFWEQVFDGARFERDPAFFYRTAAPLVYTLRAREPSAAHIALAELEKAGLLAAVITQNIDMLHEKAGSRRVIELHGAPRVHYCLRCPGIRVSYEEAAAAVLAGGMPRCPRCGGVLKPAIAFYGDPLPLEARRAACAGAQDADLMLVLGTSLSVFPAADLPRMTLRRGGRIVIVNRQDTPLDGQAILRYRELDAVFPEFQKHYF
jgi:NAD-dependent deacetylase